MDNKSNITNRLVELVKHRKTPVVVNKQSSNYVKPRRSSGGLVTGGYSADSDE